MPQTNDVQIKRTAWQASKVVAASVASRHFCRLSVYVQLDTCLQTFFLCSRPACWRNRCHRPGSQCPLESIFCSILHYQRLGIYIIIEVVCICLGAIKSISAISETHHVSALRGSIFRKELIPTDT